MVLGCYVIKIIANKTYYREFVVTQAPGSYDCYIILVKGPMDVKVKGDRIWASSIQDDTIGMFVFAGGLTANFD